MPNFNDAATLTGSRRTADGYLAGRVRCARTGTQTYKRKELKLDGDPEATIVVYRPPEAVFDTDSLASYAGKPVTMGHPKESVSADNWKDLAVGTVGSKVTRDGDTVVVDFAIMDAAVIAEVEGGTREISMGYSTPMELRDGVSPEGVAYQVVQTGPIKINHLAVVKYARGGDSLRIDDGADTWGATPVHHEDKELPMSTKIVVLGDAAVTVALTDAPAVEAFRDAMKKQLSDAVTAKKDMEEEKDEEIGKLKAANKTLQDAAMTPEKLTSVIADRVKLETSVKIIDAAIVCDGISDDDLKKAAVTARLGADIVDGASTAEINGMFRTLTVTPVNDSMRNVIRTNVNDSAASGVWGDSIAARAGVQFKKGA